MSEQRIAKFVVEVPLNEGESAEEIRLDLKLLIDDSWFIMEPSNITISHL